MWCLCSHIVQLKALSIHKQWQITSQILLHEINVRHVTYLIGSHIKIFYQLTVIQLILLYKVRLFNNSPAVVVLIGRLMHGDTSIAPSQDIHIRKITWSSHLFQPVDWSKLSCLSFYLGAQPSLVIVQVVIMVIARTINGLLLINRQIAIGQESFQKSENHHKWNI